MISSQTGWIAGGFVYSNTVLKTTNGGLNWFQQLCGINTGLLSVYFLNSFTGWASGNYGKIVKTTNGGNNWSLFQTNDILDDFWSICFTDSLTGWAGGDWGKIYKTTNGGTPIGIQPISSEIPNHFSLSQNYPNPFNPATKIKFDIPPVGQRHAFDVRLIIYDVLGREVTTLVNEKLNPGTYEVTWDASSYPSGVYFYKLITKDFSETKKMVLLK